MSDKKIETGSGNTEPKKFRNPLSQGVYRNMQCICNSGKKVKKCHGKEYALTAVEHNEITRMINDYNQAQAKLTKAVDEATNAKG